ncbi:hypothetical protein [Acidovorax sp. Root275]|uniref:hypothetical protein n=1 Tax=Acidovorax sp. Root275 TaxID=1736508 RepID=UPI000AF1A8E3|nr:hypothetical protein [Acidovorax sp. Root275]
MAIAIVHVVGALGLTTIFGVLVLVLGGWEQKRNSRRRIQEAAIALGVPVASLENDQAQVPRLIQYMAQRSSEELLRNRVSDLCGLFRTLWGWLGGILQVCIVAGVGWAMYTDGVGNAVVMWSVLAAAVFFWFVSVAFSFTCLLLTGRYPGEAKMARKSIATAIEQQKVAEGFNAVGKD